MEFEFRALIALPVEDVFAFFRDVDRYAGQEGSRVPLYERITAGPIGVGTGYREVVRLFLGLTAEIISEVTLYEPGQSLGYKFYGMGMTGELLYTFEPQAHGTRVVQRQSLCPAGLLRALSPVIRPLFARAASERLKGIKSLLERDAI